MAGAGLEELFALSFGLAAFVRYALRKELCLDLRGLRAEPRREELAAVAPVAMPTAVAATTPAVSGAGL